jgi:phage gp46-like protein
MLSICSTAIPRDRRHAFWATQPDCGTAVDDCGNVCGAPGLQFNPAIVKPNSKTPRTIVTSNYVRGLIINKLMTDGPVPDNECGFRPGMRGGHWSQSFRSDGQYVGSRIRQISPKLPISAAVSLIEGTIKSEIEFLVKYGVAIKSTVSAKYAGRNNINVAIEVFGHTENFNIGVTASRLSNQWAWAA